MHDGVNFRRTVLLWGYWQDSQVTSLMADGLVKITIYLFIYLVMQSAYSHVNIRVPSYFPNPFLHSQSTYPGNQTNLTMSCECAEYLSCLEIWETCLWKHSLLCKHHSAGHETASCNHWTGSQTNKHALKASPWTLIALYLASLLLFLLCMLLYVLQIESYRRHTHKKIGWRALYYTFLSLLVVNGDT